MDGQGCVQDTYISYQPNIEKTQASSGIVPGACAISTKNKMQNCQLWRFAQRMLTPNNHCDNITSNHRKNNKKNFTGMRKRIISDMQKGLYKITQISHNLPV